MSLLTWWVFYVYFSKVSSVHCQKGICVVGVDGNGAFLFDCRLEQRSSAPMALAPPKQFWTQVVRCLTTKKALSVSLLPVLIYFVYIWLLRPRIITGNYNSCQQKCLHLFLSWVSLSVKVYLSYYPLLSPPNFSSAFLFLHFTQLIFVKVTLSDFSQLLFGVYVWAIHFLINSREKVCLVLLQKRSLTYTFPKNEKKRRKNRWNNLNRQFEKKWLNSQ